jgi:(R,R)-butanediol dehydrogenase/meso-butanediol dehydrogenase/diacetyl reductase
MVASGRFPVEKVISATIEADDVIAKGFEVLTDPTGNAQKILVEAPR